MRAPARRFVPGGGICSTAAPEPIDCSRKPAFNVSSVTCRRDLPLKSGTVMSPNCAPASSLVRDAFMRVPCDSGLRKGFGGAEGLGCLTAYCGAYDGTSGGTDI